MRELQVTTLRLGVLGNVNIDFMQSYCTLNLMAVSPRDRIIAILNPKNTLDSIGNMCGEFNYFHVCGVDFTLNIVKLGNNLRPCELCLLYHIKDFFKNFDYEAMAVRTLT